MKDRGSARERFLPQRCHEEAPAGELVRRRRRGGRVRAAESMSTRGESTQHEQHRRRLEGQPAVQYRPRPGEHAPRLDSATHSHAPPRNQRVHRVGRGLRVVGG